MKPVLRAFLGVLVVGLASGAPAFAQARVVTAGQDGVAAPKRIKTVSPVYPQEAMAQGIRGIVILEVLIDPQGKVTSAEIIRSIPGLDEAALDAVRKWEYEVTKVGGQPVSVKLTVPITFAMKVPEVTRAQGIPELRQGAAIQYPAGKTEGESVTAEVTLAPDGQVAEAEVTKGNPPFSVAVLSALRTWRFAGEAEEVVLSFRVEADFAPPRGGDKGRVEIRLTGLRRSEAARGPAAPTAAAAPATAPAAAPVPAPAIESPAVDRAPEGPAPRPDTPTTSTAAAPTAPPPADAPPPAAAPATTTPSAAPVTTPTAPAAEPAAQPSAPATPAVASPSTPAPTTPSGTPQAPSSTAPATTAPPTTTPPTTAPPPPAPVAQPPVTPPAAAPTTLPPPTQPPAAAPTTLPPPTQPPAAAPTTLPPAGPPAPTPARPGALTEAERKPAQAAPPVEVISAPRPVEVPPQPVEPGVSAIKDVTLALGVPDLVRGRRPVPPPLARMGGTTGAVEVKFGVDASGATSVTEATGPQVLSAAATYTVQSWYFRRVTAERLHLVAVFDFAGETAKVSVKPE